MVAKRRATGQGRSRPKIRPQTVCELWARAAGRCEFRGCNEPVYKDLLTQAHANLALISHVVAFRPDGPRGDPVRSPLLATNIGNLMLTCPKHGKLIDDGTLVAAYPEALLLEYKQEHELRIQMLTEITEDSRTHVLLLQASIDARRVPIDPKAAFRAILPLYPAEEEPMRIDLNSMRIQTTTDGYFQVAAECITQEWKHCSSGRAISRLAVFALAPVPLLIHFGHLLGDLEHIDLFQRHRDSQDWIWKAPDGEQNVGEVLEAGEGQEVVYDVRAPEARDDGASPIAVVLSVSASIALAEVEKAVGPAVRVYEIRARMPGPDFLRSRARLELFGVEFRKLLEKLYERVWQRRTISACQ